ncbi:MAG TPA: ribonuclease HII [Clostridiales bacterium]|nr:ribonuclease HII [Clostridiales bacterium]
MDKEKKGVEKIQKLQNQYESMLAYERQAWQQGFTQVAGIDEAGRGPLAGPVVAAACILDPARPILGLNDSKKLTPASRDRLYALIVGQSLAWQVAFTDPQIIDRINILQATCQAMRQAIAGLKVKPDLLLIDAVRLTGVISPVWPIIRGDALSVSIAAASILAKVTRDRLMSEYEEVYPGYGFERHKGYGTTDHYAALMQLGPCPIHRQTFLRSIADQLAGRQFIKPDQTGVNRP